MFYTCEPDSEHNSNVWPIVNGVIGSGGSRGGATGANAPPFKKSKKNKFLAIFDGFWPITMFLCVILLRMT